MLNFTSNLNFTSPDQNAVYSNFCRSRRPYGGQAKLRRYRGHHLGPCAELFFFFSYLPSRSSLYIYFIHMANTTAMIMRCTVCRNPVCAAFEPDIYDLVDIPMIAHRKNPILIFFLACVHVWSCRSPTSSPGASKKSSSSPRCISR